MEEKIKLIEGQINSFFIKTKEELEQYRIQFVSKKGLVAALFEELKTVTAEQRKLLGKTLNDLKRLSEEKLKEAQDQLDRVQDQGSFSGDLTLPSISNKTGSHHPLNLTRYRIIEIFERLGFCVEDGPEVEDDWHNFTALNFAENHPAREMQDTFFVEKNPDVLLRTHTSNVQIRLMKSQKPPIRAIMHFPFTEPSAEIDISCLICKGDGCNVCKQSGWVEIAGSGMVHPNVLKNCGIDPETYTGFAFGMGIERVTQLRYRVNDLRLYSENDIRFLKQFKQVI
ncbi:MAG: phenylalanine--tRNA ligase subunit alpha [Bacteroidetes bacterium]|nr:phenylalanine--tRNA ligase subunit alpha [Bacteroidota bacterium]